MTLFCTIPFFTQCAYCVRTNESIRVARKNLCTNDKMQNTRAHVYHPQTAKHPVLLSVSDAPQFASVRTCLNFGLLDLKSKLIVFYTYQQCSTSCRVTEVKTLQKIHVTLCRNVWSVTNNENTKNSRMETPFCISNFFYLFFIIVSASFR